MLFLLITLIPQLHAVELRGFDEFKSFKEKFVEGRREEEFRILEEYETNKRSFISGYCKLCEKKNTIFYCPEEYFTKKKWTSKK